MQVFVEFSKTLKKMFHHLSLFIIRTLLCLYKLQVAYTLHLHKQWSIEYLLLKSQREYEMLSDIKSVYTGFGAYVAFYSMENEEDFLGCNSARA
jgi:hypothetical protein